MEDNKKVNCGIWEEYNIDYDLRNQTIKLRV